MCVSSSGQAGGPGFSWEWGVEVPGGGTVRLECPTCSGLSVSPGTLVSSSPGVWEYEVPAGAVTVTAWWAGADQAGPVRLWASGWASYLYPAPAEDKLYALAVELPLVHDPTGLMDQALMGSGWRMAGRVADYGYWAGWFGMWAGVAVFAFSLLVSLASSAVRGRVGQALAGSWRILLVLAAPSLYDAGAALTNIASKMLLSPGADPSGYRETVSLVWASASDLLSGFTLGAGNPLVSIVTGSIDALTKLWFQLFFTVSLWILGPARLLAVAAVATLLPASVALSGTPGARKLGEWIAATAEGLAAASLIGSAVIAGAALVVENPGGWFSTVGRQTYVWGVPSTGWVAMAAMIAALLMPLSAPLIGLVFQTMAQTAIGFAASVALGAARTTAAAAGAAAGGLAGVLQARPVVSAQETGPAAKARAYTSLFLKSAGHSIARTWRLIPGSQHVELLVAPVKAGAERGVAEIVERIAEAHGRDVLGDTPRLTQILTGTYGIPEKRSQNYAKKTSQKSRYQQQR